MSSILIAVAVLSVLALVFGVILGFASKKFKVEGNPIIDQVETLLPQTQCGQCGYPGCRPYAEAIANGDKINKCPPGGTATMEKIAELMGVEPEAFGEEAQASVKKVAYIRADE
ncbi:RnfABCDGE type electron transport complex subunit B, partial [Shewanella sp. SR41-2]|nr:RnfABCDGE type electron transport complex subunit B [Shewanella sp. SR41-2]